jgi:hypothetical protein
MSDNIDAVFQKLTGASSLAADNTKNWRSILLAIVCFVIEAILLYGFVISKIAVVVFYSVHLLFVVLLALNIRFASKSHEDLRYPCLLFFAVLGTGPFGSAGFLVMSLLYPLLSRISTPFSRWLKDLFPAHQNVSENIYARIHSGWDDYHGETEVTPFLDIMHFGTLAQKQSVLDAVLKDFVPQYSSILKLALKDPSNSIRIQAAAIVAKLEFDFEERLKKLLREHTEDPKNPTLVLQIAEHLDAFAFTGILNPAREIENRQNAYLYYTDYLERSPQDQKCWLVVGRLLLRQQQYAAVLDWYEKYNFQFEIPSGVALSWYLEALYMLRDYKQLETKAPFALEVIRKEGLPQDLIAALESWRKGGVENNEKSQ